MNALLDKARSREPEFYDGEDDESGFQEAYHQAMDFGIVNIGDLVKKEFNEDWLIEGLMTSGQPQLYGGPSKSLKTSIAADQCISLAAGVPFLGCFKVPKAKRVLFISSESGDRTLKETAKKICAAKGVKPDDLRDQLHFGFVPPQLTSPQHVRALIVQIKKLKADVVVIDPAYLSLGLSSADASCQFTVGRILNQSLTHVSRETEATTVLVTHFRKDHRVGRNPPQINDMAGAGFSQWARQWVLLNRRSQFNPNQPGVHKLVMSYGGSFGHVGTKELDIDEGRIDDRDWNVSVRDASEGQPSQNNDRNVSTVESHKRSIIRLLTENAQGLTKTKISEFAGINTRNVTKALQEMVESNELEQGLVPTGTPKKDGTSRLCEGYKLKA
jgi:hypothetical protein